MERLYLKPALCKAIEEYCKLNNIEDTNAFANRCATQGFNIVKFGLSPKDNIERENKGIKDIKNESRKKRKEQSRLSEEGKQGGKKDPGSEDKREQEKGNGERPEANEKNLQPIEKGKEVTVRKIVVIKKNKKDD
jgi:hypothetical protein